MAGLLRGLGQVIDPATAVAIDEVHHQDKLDAPSGTALFLARQLRTPAGGSTGTDPRRIAEEFPGIAFTSRREGEVVGDHVVSLQLRDETLTLAHHAQNRTLFARGALEAGQWLSAQKPGRYSPSDWIATVAGFGLSGSNGQA
jgi:4-hydroxy-tetrahydrodipicolinate reductase